MITLGSRTFDSVDDLEKLVIHAATEYELNGYVEDFDGSEITDPEYDDLLRELRTLKPTSKAFDGTSPSMAQTSGDIVVHKPPMTSIDKADGDLPKKQKRYADWLKNCETSIGKKPDICQSYKRDGVALRVNYVKGKLVSAGLRPRDGVNGSDVTRHMKHIQGIPAKLPHPFTLSLNGEIECWFKDFDAINAERDAAGEEQYKNPRNYTAGCLGRDDAAETKNCRLRIAFYSITGFDEWEDHYKTEIDRAIWANSKDGLNLVDSDGKGYFVRMLPHKEHQLALMEDHAKHLPYYVDGVVLKVNNLTDQESLGHMGNDPTKAPHGALAWKFAEETAEAVVSRIEWNASRTGRVVPTAIFDKPFKLADTSNSRATCNNYGWMESRGLGPGAKVKCKKGGKIIPNIMEVLTRVTDIGAPTHCPSCQCQLRVVTSSSGNKDLNCANDDCAAKHIQGWIFFLTNMGAKGLGAASMELILNSGKVKKFPDLYKLEEADLTSHGFSAREALLAIATIWLIKHEKSDQRMRDNIAAARKKKMKIQAWQFFAALGIPSAGRSAGKELVAELQTWDAIRTATVDTLQNVSGIGEKTAKAIYDYFQKRGTVVDELTNDYIELELPKIGKLTGTNFVLTGSFALGKPHWEDKIQELGGNVQSSVGKKTNYCVRQHGKPDGTPSDKEEKAKELKIPIISVADLEKML